MNIRTITTANQIHLENERQKLVLGYFDGLHLGHQELLKRRVRSRKKRLKVALLTFLNLLS